MCIRDRNNRSFRWAGSHRCRFSYVWVLGEMTDWIIIRLLILTKVWFNNRRIVTDWILSVCSSLNFAIGLHSAPADEEKRDTLQICRSCDMTHWIPQFHRRPFLCFAYRLHNKKFRPSIKLFCGLLGRGPLLVEPNVSTAVAAVIFSGLLLWSDQDLSLIHI